MRKVIVALGQPTIDMPVKGKDASGNSAVITAVFKRYNEKKTQELLNEVTEISQNIYAAGNLEKAILILRREIVALKEVTLLDAEDGQPVVTIADTRAVLTSREVAVEVGTKDEEPAPWELGPDKCLAFLLDLYLATPAWGAAFIRAFFAVHNNDVTYIESLAGN
jgi:hypothetical protein